MYRYVDVDASGAADSASINCALFGDLDAAISMIDDVVLGDNDAAGVFGTPNRPNVPAAIDVGIDPAKVAKAARHSGATCGDCCSHDAAGE